MIAAVPIVDSLARNYGPYAFGPIVVLVLMGASAALYVKVWRPGVTAAMETEKERTKQTENLRSCAAENAETAKANTETAKTLGELHKSIERTQAMQLEAIRAIAKTGITSLGDDR